MSQADVLRRMLAGHDFDRKLSSLYRGDPANPKQRYRQAIERFEALFGAGRDLWIFSAPGRSELSGNHTDHQHGRVLAAAVTLDVIAVVAPRADMTVDLRSEGFRPCQLDLADLAGRDAEAGSSAALVRGIAAGLAGAGWLVGGFDAYTASLVPSGSGLSSSAAFEILTGTIFNHLYNQGRIDTVSIAKTGQFSENRYFGKPCGLMDQTASAFGGVVAIDFAVPDQPAITPLAVDFKAMGYALFVINAGGSHADLTGDYAAIPAEMREVAACFGQDVLRDVDPQSFAARVPELRRQVGDRAILRAKHFFDENERVLLQADALRRADMAEYLRLMQASGDSSAMLLQNIYPSGHDNERSVALALALCHDALHGLGAWRVHGGGFAGTVQALVPLESIDSFRSAIEPVFGAEACVELAVRPTGGHLFWSGAMPANA